MKLANQEQKKAFEELDLDKLDELRDEMEEIMEESDYINDRLNLNYEFMDVTEEDLDDQFAELEAEYQKKNHVEAKSVSQKQYN